MFGASAGLWFVSVARLIWRIDLRHEVRSPSSSQFMPVHRKSVGFTWAIARQCWEPDQAGARTTVEEARQTPYGRQLSRRPR